MPGILETITAIIGLSLLVSIAIFVFSFIHHWGKIYKIYWGIVVFLCTHLLLFSLVLFVQPTKLPSLLHAYAVGVLDILNMLVTF
jgi:hypothetical protein